MPISINLLKSISSISQEDFNKIFPNSLEGYSLFRTLEESALDNFELFYILAKDEDAKLLAIFPFYFMNYPLNTSVQGPLKKITSQLAKIFPNIFTIKLIICGCPIVDYADIGLVKQDYQKTLKAIMAKLDELCLQKKINIIAFKDFRKDRYGHIVQFLLANGFFEIPTFPCAQLDIQFKNFDEYLMSLSSATRKDMRRKLKKAGFDKMQLGIQDNISEISDEIYRLYANAVAASSVSFEKLKKDFFVNVSTYMPGIAKFFIYKIDGKIVAFNLVFVKDKTCIDKYIGFDYDVCPANKLYFTTWALNINWCIQNGIATYQVGQTDYDAKIRLGSKLIPLYIYAKHRNRLLNQFFKIIGMLLKPANFDPALKRIINNKKYEKIFISN